MQRQAGFTLLELLVALSIFALISAMAYGGLQSVMTTQQHTAKAAQNLADLQKAYRIMQRDLEQIIARRIRNEYGDTVEALVGGRGFTGIEFSRAGRPNPAGFLRSDVQRVAYVPGQDDLLRQTWRVLDRAQDSRPDEQVLVENITRFSMRFLDASNNWREDWPPPQQNQGQIPTPPAPLPKAVEVQLELEDLGILNWIFRLPDMYVPAQQTAGSGTNNPGSNAATGGNKAQP